MANHFWSGFVSEYLPRLTSSSNLNLETQPVEENEVVILADDNKSRGSWPLGRIIIDFPGAEVRFGTAVEKQNWGLLMPVSKLCLLEES